MLLGLCLLREQKEKQRRRETKMAGGQAAPPPKQEELQPHPSKDQLPNIFFCITSPPPWREFLQKNFAQFILLLSLVDSVPCLH